MMDKLWWTSELLAAVRIHTLFPGMEGSTDWWNANKRRLLFYGRWTKSEAFDGFLLGALCILMAFEFNLWQFLWQNQYFRRFISFKSEQISACESKHGELSCVSTPAMNYNFKLVK